jgi:hypothetical protein
VLKCSSGAAAVQHTDSGDALIFTLKANAAGCSDSGDVTLTFSGRR